MSTETYQPFAEGYIEIHDSSTITELKSWKVDAKTCTEPEAWIQDLSWSAFRVHRFQNYFPFYLMRQSKPTAVHSDNHGRYATVSPVCVMNLHRSIKPAVITDNASAASEGRPSGPEPRRRVQEEPLTVVIRFLTWLIFSGWIIFDDHLWWS